MFRPPLFAYPHDLFSCGPFFRILGFFGVRQSCSCAGVDRRGFYSADSSASLAQCGLGGDFLPSFAIFVLVWDLHQNFRFYSLASLLGLPFLLRLSLLLSLSLLRLLALDVLAADHILLWFLSLFFGVFLSVATVLFPLPLSFWGWAQALAGTPWCVCSACPGAPAVFPLCVMQLATLLGFHTWLTQVGCPTSAVTVSRGVGVVLVQMFCYPLVVPGGLCFCFPGDVG